jgi:hypothetical protein
MLGQFVARPLPLHRRAPSVGTEWTRRVLRSARTWALTSGLGLSGNEVPRMTSVGTLGLPLAFALQFGESAAHPEPT